MPKLSEFKKLSLSSPFRFTLIFAVPFMLIIIALLTALLIWESKLYKRDQKNELLEAGRAFFSQILVARQWNIMHNGIYVEVTEKTQPNPYLKVPHRDITSIDGKKYTMINPSYMTRQMSELANELGEFKFHITSLKYINPINKPDEWEAQALYDFERGSSESFTFVQNADERIFRFMAPLHIGEDCLRCHHEEGYIPGDIRGGISVSIPIGLSDRIHTAKFKRSVVSYGSIGIAALLFVIMITWAFSKTVVRSIESEVESNKLKVSIVLARTAAHELRQPMTILMGFSELIKNRDEELTDEIIDIIVDQCKRMDNIISNMINITEYKTKDYTPGIELFDLSSKKAEPDENQ